MRDGLELDGYTVVVVQSRDLNDPEAMRSHLASIAAAIGRAQGEHTSSRPHRQHEALGPNCPLPLFEAVANSIHAVHDAKAKNGRIEIKIIRDAGQGVLKPEMRVGQPVESCEVTD